MLQKTLESVVASFGESAAAKLSNPAISGAPEDQLRGPLEEMIGSGVAGLLDLPVNLIGETSLSDIKTRPDYAVTVHKALVGFIEAKAPGKGADPRRFHDPHDWEIQTQDTSSHWAFTRRKCLAFRRSGEDQG